MQLLHYLQQHHNNLSPQQQDLWHQLSKQYQSMRQHQQDQRTHQHTRSKSFGKGDPVYIKEEITSTTDGNDDLDAVIAEKILLAESLVKQQYGSNGIQIKQEDGKKCRIPSLQNDSETNKCEATSTSARQSIPKYEVQNEPIYTHRKHTFSTDMTSEEIIDMVK